MNIVFVEPVFPASQRQFVRALAQVGATVIGVGESPPQDLDDELRSWMRGYYRVTDATDADQLGAAVTWAGERLVVDRLEATLGAHQVAAATVREAHGIPGTPVETTRYGADRGATEEALRRVGVPTSASATVSTAGAVRAIASRVGYPLLLRRHAAAGSRGAVRIDSDIKLSAALIGFGDGGPLTVQQYVEGHRGFYDTLTHDGAVVHDWVTHCYPDVSDLAPRHASPPQSVTTNRIDAAPFYREVRELGARVSEALGVTGGATRLHWSSGERGLHVTGLDCWLPASQWDTCSAADDVDTRRAWAQLVVDGVSDQRLSRSHAVGTVTLPLDGEGLVHEYPGLDGLRSRHGQWVVGEHLPPPGTPTRDLGAGRHAGPGGADGPEGADGADGSGAGAWLRMRHPDYDVLRGLLDEAAASVRVHVV